jgi:hypothetical protein
MNPAAFAGLSGAMTDAETACCMIRTSLRSLNKRVCNREERHMAEPAKAEGQLDHGRAITVTLLKRYAVIMVVSDLSSPRVSNNRRAAYGRFAKAEIETACQ